MKHDWLSYELYLFDLDDTLINTKAAVHQAWQVALELWSSDTGISKDVAQPVLEECVRHFGSTAYKEYWHAFVNEMIEGSLENPSLIYRCQEAYYQAYWNFLHPLEGAVEFLEWLQSHQKTLGLVTNGFWNFQFEKVTHTRLDPFFTSHNTVCAHLGEVTRRKPNPTMLLQQIEKLQKSSISTIFFGNAVTDIMAGNLASVTTVAVNNIANPMNLKVMTPDLVVSSWRSIVE